MGFLLSSFLFVGFVMPVGFFFFLFLCFYFTCRKRSCLGMQSMYFLRIFSKKAIESLEKPCPFHVDVLVMRIQHCPSSYFRIRAEVPASDPVRIQGRPFFGV